MSPCYSSALSRVEEGEKEEEGFTVWLVLTFGVVVINVLVRSGISVSLCSLSSLFLRLLFWLSVAIVDGKKLHSTCLCTCGRLVHCSIV